MEKSIRQETTLLVKRTSLKQKMQIKGCDFTATVEKRGSSYRITVSCNYDSNGRQIRKKMTWVPDPGMTQKQIEKELERQKVLFENKVKRGQQIDGSIKFSEFADKWINEYASEQLRPTTMSRYRAMLPRINNAIGHIKLDKLQPHQLLAFYKNLSEAGIRDDKKYKPKLDLKLILTKLNITQTKFAALAGVNIQSVYNLIKNKTVSDKTAVSICEVLGLNFDEAFSVINADKGLSDKTIQHHHRLISSILTTAVQWQVILSNPCDRVKPPRVEHKEPQYLDEIQSAELLKCLDEENIQFKTMICTLIFTGLRRGELLGLKWSDIDFNKCTISVNRSSLYLPEKGIFEDTTKNYSSKRSIKVSQTAIDCLKDFKKWQTTQRIKLGGQWTDTDFVFTSNDGNPMHPDTISAQFHKFIKKNNLPAVSIHSLRHTNATLQIAGGVPVTTVAERLGHATPNTTTKIYAHAIQSANAAAADTLQDMLSLNSKTKKTV